MYSITLLSPSELTPYNKNARLHSESQIDQIIASMKEFGWTRPIIIDENHMTLAGHGRHMAAIKLNMAQVPCRIITGLTDEQKKAYILADNALAELSEWDEDFLAEELSQLKAETYDLSLMGFNFEFDLETVEREERLTSGKGTIEYEAELDFNYTCPHCHFNHN